MEKKQMKEHGGVSQFQSLPSCTTRRDRVCDEDVVRGTWTTRLFTLRFLLPGLVLMAPSRLNTVATERTRHPTAPAQTPGLR